MLNIKKKQKQKISKKKNFHPHPHLPHVLPHISHETTPNSFQLISTTSRSINQNFKLIGQTNAEKMRDMTQTTDHRHDRYITALFFFCRGGKKSKFF
jgi:hypothetical protein